MTGFSITEQKGFHVTFENGWTVSVQFGHDNYCANRHSTETPVPPSPDAEVAAWNAAGKWYQFESDQVQGHMSPADVLAFMNEIASKEKLP